MPRIVPFLLLLLAAVSMPHEAGAQVRQCVIADGSVVYTDRTCQDIGGSERREPYVATPGASASRLHRGGCSRSVQDLAYALGNAIQSGDPNQIAGIYDWAGMSTANGYRLFSRLEAIAKRPLIDVQPVYAGGTNEYGYDVVEFDETTGEAISKPARKAQLIGLRVDQTLGSTTTPSQTVFGLRKHFGCWWVRL